MAVKNYGVVLIPKSSLRDVRIYSIAADVDFSIGMPDSLPPNAPTGYTEWAGQWQDRPVSVGWDWALIEDSLVVLNPMEIRTNISIISDSGVREPVRTSRALLYEWIEATIDWRRAINARLMV